ncbi:hypothetical protein GCM10010174_84120 [Kutzneria viridogrisea]
MRLRWVLVAVLAVFAAALLHLGALVGFLPLHQEEECRAAIGTAFPSPPAGMRVDYAEQVFPPSARCAWRGYGTVDLVPAWVTPSMVVLLAVGGVAMSFALLPGLPWEKRAPREGTSG